MTTRHVAVWIDHKEARLFNVAKDSFEESTLKSPHHHLRKHEGQATAEHDHPDDQKRFFHDVARTLETAEEILVLGPSTAKLQFLTYLHAHDPKLAARVFGIETVDHPTDPQIAAYARKYFQGADRVRGIAH